MITYESIEIPDTLLIGVIRSQWPIQLFYNDQQAAAEWLAQGADAADRRVFRVRLDVVEQLDRVPPVPARLEMRPVRLARENQYGATTEQAPVRCVASKHIPTTGASCSVCGAGCMQHEDDHPSAATAPKASQDGGDVR